ncbi:cytochrome P450 [Amanita rubescens]|nr:cytochrome P450 [Amanita rubescens]KAF8344574.1 cytochrome P450 [Amanita rubescens]
MRYAIDQLSPTNTAILLFALLVAFQFVRLIRLKRSGTRTPKLQGPSPTSLLFGRLHEVNRSRNRAATYGQWASKYGQVFQIPAQLGGRHIILLDPKAIAHFLSKDTFTYVGSSFSKSFIKKFFGPNMIYAENMDHFRQRRNLAPAFSNAALRSATSVFYESAYKVKGYWNAQFESKDEVVIDVQKWINAITLDSIGIAGFGHDFKSIDGVESPVNDVFRYFNDSDSNDARVMIDMIGPIFPFVHLIPFRTMRMFGALKKAMDLIATELIQSSETERDTSSIKDRSMLGMLVRGRTEDASFKMLQDEIVSQNILLFAGHETTAISLAWVLIELARKPEVQCKLREELRQFPNSDPTWDQLTSELPYLNAVANESIRLHPPVEDVLRVAAGDDVIPLGIPIKTASGQVIDSLVVTKGTILSAPFIFTNRNERSWGPDAKEFKPERFFHENPNVQRHLLSFSDGPRICLGRNFALTEFKAVLSVLIRNFSFELLNGPDTEIDVHFSLMNHPKMAGQRGAALPLRVRQVLD